MMNLVPAPSTLRGVGARLRGLVPDGRRLPERVWSRRHRGILVLLWMHAVGIAVFAAVRQFEVSHVLLEAGAVGVTAVLAGVLPGPRRLRSVIACFGLMTSSALLVHLSGGYIEFHFHFFVMVGLLALYQDRTTFVNAAAARMLRCSAEDLIGRPLGAVILHPPDPAGAPCRLYANMSVGPAPDAAEDFFKSVDGRAFPVEYVSSQIREHGNVEGAVVVFRDVSQRRTTQAALQESEARLRQSQKMDAIGQLAGGIAHDFSNLLTVIIGRGELLRGRLTSSSDRETVSLITETAERASILTRQLLVFSRKQVLEPRVLDLGEVVAGMASMLRRLIGEHIS